MSDYIESAGKCCGGPAPYKVEACCVKDAEEKQKGNTGCGCSSEQPKESVKVQCCSPS